MKTSYGKGLRGKATKLHSQVVRSRGKCEKCGSQTALQTAHIITRRYPLTRTDEKNAFCLCAKCHRRFTEWPDEWMDFIFDKIGRDEFYRLKEKSQQKLTGRRTDDFWGAEVSRLMELLGEK